jgi:hypothetical protein
MGHIFISYSHKDTEYAHRFADHLHGMGFDVWIDERLDYGSQWPHEIQKQLDTCDAFLLIMSPRSFASEWVQSELQRAKRKLKPIFPLLLEGDEPWLSVESIQYYDVRGEKLPDAKFYSNLKRVVSVGHADTTLGMSKKVVGTQPAGTKTPKSGINPILLVGAPGLLLVIFAACAGSVLGMGYLVSQLRPPPMSESSLTLQQTATATSIPPTETAIPPTNTPRFPAPAIDSVSLREETTSSGLVIYQDVHFHDDDGDAYLIDFTLVSDLPDAVIRDGPIEQSSQEQKTGAIHTGTWRCGSGDYQVTLQVTILDRAGNRSNTVEFTMFCHN